MKLAAFALAFAVTALPTLMPVHAQGATTGEQTQGTTTTDEQVLLKQVMTDRRSVYAQNMNMTDAQSRAFWPIYDEYEGKVKKLDDQFIALVNDFAAKYDTLTDADAAKMLQTKMSIERDRMALKQTYTKKIAKVLPASKALRYSQLETRIETLIRRQVYGLIPLAR